MKKLDKFIVRGDRSGVFYGEIKERQGREVTMTNCRRLWYWNGANSISQLAQLGTCKPQDCKFSVAVDEVLILDAIEINKCSEKAIKVIDEVLAWIRKE